MVVDDLNTSANYRLTRILGLLESLYGITIDFEAASSDVDLRGLQEHCARERGRIIRESAYNSYNGDPNYTKLVLIQEALGIFLSEVAPKRIKRNKNPRKEQTR